MDLSKSQAKIEGVSAALLKIREEYNALVKELGENKLNSTEVKDLVNRYAAEVFQIYNVIKLI